MILSFAKKVCDNILCINTDKYLIYQFILIFFPIKIPNYEKFGFLLRNLNSLQTAAFKGTSLRAFAFFDEKNYAKKAFGPLFTKTAKGLIPWVILLDTKKSVSYNLGGSCFDYFCKQIECGGDIHFERKWKRTLRKFFS